MALFYKVDEPEDIAKAFAAHDIYTSIVNDLFGRVLTPSDDFYTAPWAFMPERRARARVRGGYVVMTCMVPWLHGHGYLPGTREARSSEDSAKNVREQHFTRAHDIMWGDGDAEPDLVPPLLEFPERMQDQCMLDEEDVFVFTDDGCYPTERDVIPALEDRAVEIISEAMGWTIPSNWRSERERERANWTPRKNEQCADEANDDELCSKRMKYTTTTSSAPLGSSRQTSQQEEKKDHNYDIQRDASYDTYDTLDTDETENSGEGGIGIDFDEEAESLQNWYAAFSKFDRECNAGQSGLGCSRFSGSSDDLMLLNQQQEEQQIQQQQQGEQYRDSFHDDECNDLRNVECSDGENNNQATEV